MQPDPTTHQLIAGDAATRTLELPAGSADQVATSPPYPGGQRHYGDHPDEVGRGTLADWLAEMGAVLDACEHALHPEGTAWFVIGDKAIGSGGAGGDFRPGHAKAWNDMARTKFRPGAGLEHLRDGQWAQAPERFAMLAQERGWLLRSTIVWNKAANERAAVGHVRRPLIRTERIIVLARSKRYRWNVDAHLALPEPERGDVWTIRPRRVAGSVRHFAPFPQPLAERMISLGSFEGGTVLDPFMGSGTTGHAAAALGRNSIGIDLYPATVVKELAS